MATFGRNMSWFGSGSSAASRNTNSTKKKLTDYLDRTRTAEVRKLGRPRADRIVSNLNTGLQTNPNLFANRASYKSAYGYDTADAGKKALMDAFWAKNAPATAKAPVVGQPGTATGSAPTGARPGGITDNIAANITANGPSARTALTLAPPKLERTATIKAAPVTTVKTGNEVLDATGARSARSANRYSSDVANVMNVRNRNLWAISDNYVKWRQGLAEMAGSVSDQRQRAALANKEAAIARENANHAAAVADFNAKEYAASRNARKMASAAKLMASLTGGAGGSGELNMIASAVRMGDRTMKEFASARVAMNRSFTANIANIEARYLQNSAQINRTYFRNISSLNKETTRMILGIEKEKGNNSIEALNAIRNANKDHAATTLTLTKERADRKTEAAKIARENLKLEYRKIKDRKELEIRKMKELAKTAVAGPGDIPTYARALFEGKITAASVPESIRTAVLKLNNDKYPPTVKARASRLISVLPRDLIKSDKDRDFRLGRIYSMIDQGLSDRAIRLELLGVSKTKVPPEMVRNMLEVAGDNDTFDAAKNALIAWNAKAAAKNIETKKLDKSGLLSKYNDTINTLDPAIEAYEILQKMNTKWTLNKLNAINSTINDWTSKVSSDPNETNIELKRLSSALRRMNTLYRKANFGTWVSWAEARSASDVFAGIKMNSVSLATALDGFMNRAISSIDTIRISSALPTMSEAFESNPYLTGGISASEMNSMNKAILAKKLSVDPSVIYEPVSYSRWADETNYLK